MPEIFEEHGTIDAQHWPPIFIASIINDHGQFLAILLLLFSPNFSKQLARNYSPSVG